MDFALKRFVFPSKSSTKAVSILVLVDFALKPECRNKFQVVLSFVSILVLVDFALKLNWSFSILFELVCFNPCFGGFCS